MSLVTSRDANQDGISEKIWDDLVCVWISVGKIQKDILDRSTKIQTHTIIERETVCENPWTRNPPYWWGDDDLGGLEIFSGKVGVGAGGGRLGGNFWENMEKTRTIWWIVFSFSMLLLLFIL